MARFIMEDIFKIKHQFTMKKITAQAVDELDNDPNFVDSSGFSIADRFEVFDDEEGSHHCDDLSCNCSI